jgi:hypothetical protein
MMSGSENDDETRAFTQTGVSYSEPKKKAKKACFCFAHLVTIASHQSHEIVVGGKPTVGHRHVGVILLQRWTA